MKKVLLSIGISLLAGVCFAGAPGNFPLPSEKFSTKPELRIPRSSEELKPPKLPGSPSTSSISTEDSSIYGDVCDYVKKLVKNPPPEGWYIGPQERACLLRLVEGDKALTEDIKSLPENCFITKQGIECKKTSSQQAKRSSPKGTGQETAERSAKNSAPGINGERVSAELKEEKFNKVKLELNGGYLSENIARLLEKYGWVTPPGWWDAEEDYLIVHPFTVEGQDLFDAFAKLLKPYRLKIRFFKWDKTVQVTSVHSS